MTLRRHLAAAALALALATPALAQDFVFGFSPRTGDAFVDAQLGDINVFARGNTDGFIDDIVVGFGAPRTLVQELYVTRRWAPGDIYYACAIARQLGRPCVEIVDIWERDHGLGWGVVAQRLGIRPGSAAFHALKGRVGQGHGAMRGRAGKAAAGNSPGDSRGQGPGARDKGNGNGNGQGKGKGNGRG